MNDLQPIKDFGAIDAESDDLLAKCFESHPAYLEALDGRRFLVLGRKGAGKTAVYKKIILLRDPLTFSVGHSFADYPWHYHDAQVVPSAAEQERYLHSWKYLILLSLSKILLNFDQSQPWSDGAMEALAKIEALSSTSTARRIQTSRKYFILGSACDISASSRWIGRCSSLKKRRMNSRWNIFPGFFRTSIGR